MTEESFLKTHIKIAGLKIGRTHHSIDWLVWGCFTCYLEYFLTDSSDL